MFPFAARGHPTGPPSPVSLPSGCEYNITARVGQALYDHWGRNWYQNVGPRWRLFAGGLLLMLGFLWPLGPIASIAAMLMAVVRFHLPGTLFGPKGFEYPLLLLLLSAILGLVGPGQYALDAAISLHLPTTLLFWVGLAGAVIIDAVGYTISESGKQGQTPAQTSTQGLHHAGRASSVRSILDCILARRMRPIDGDAL
jgi:hypothetical protein